MDELLKGAIQLITALGGGAVILKLIDRFFDRDENEETREGQAQETYYSRLEARCATLETSRDQLERALKEERDARQAEMLAARADLADLRRLINEVSRENLAYKRYTEDLEGAIGQESAVIRGRIRRRLRTPRPGGELGTGLDEATRGALWYDDRS